MKNRQATYETLQIYWNKFYAYALSLRDPRQVGLLVFGFLVLLVTWSGAKAVQANFTLERQVYELQRTNEVKRLENANIELTNDYYGTSQYLEVTARQNLGLAAPGETVLLVSKDTALAHTIALPKADETTTTPKAEPFWQHNFRSWVDFFLHRTSSSS